MTDDEIYLQEQASSISALSPKLLDPEITIDYDKIDEIYNMHESDEIYNSMSHSIKMKVMKLEKNFMKSIPTFILMEWDMLLL